MLFSGQFDSPDVLIRGPQTTAEQQSRCQVDQDHQMPNVVLVIEVKELVEEPPLTQNHHDDHDARHHTGHILHHFEQRAHD